MVKHGFLRHLRGQHQAPQVPVDPLDRQPILPRFLVILFAVALIWSWVLLLGWWMLR